MTTRLRQAGPILLAFALLATACGDDDDDGATPEPDEQEQTSDSGGADADGGADDGADDGSDATDDDMSDGDSDATDDDMSDGDSDEPAEKVTIDFASFGTDDEDIERALIEAFEAENPDVEVGSIEYLAPSDYWTRMEALAATDDLPCVMWMSSGFVEGWTNDGLLIDIQDYVDRDISLDDYFSGTFDVARNKDTGNMHAFPFRFVETVMYYNIDAFDEAGVAHPSEGWTWDDYLAAAEALGL